MLEKIRNILLVMTGLGAVVSIYFKTVNSFAIDVIRNKYKNVPGKQPIFDTVINFISYCFIVIYIILLVIGIIDFFISKGWRTLIEFPKGTGIISWIITLVGLAFIIFPAISFAITLINFFTIKNKFIEKLENKDDIEIEDKTIKMNRIGIILSIIIAGVWLFFSLSIVVDGIDIINK